MVTLSHTFCSVVYIVGVEYGVTERYFPGGGIDFLGKRGGLGKPSCMGFGTTTEIAARRYTVHTVYSTTTLAFI